MDEIRIRNLIKVWYQKARFERDPFSKFVFLWICFNAWIDYRSGEDIDVNMIKTLANRDGRMQDMLVAYADAMQSGTEVFKNHIKTLVLTTREKPIEDMRGRKPPISIADENDFANIVWAIYRIRCNLFHGGKEANSPRDQKLVVVAQRILEKWIGDLIASWRN